MRTKLNSVLHDQLTIPKHFELTELVKLKQGIVVESCGSENMYFDYINDLGHVQKGYYKF